MSLWDKLFKPVVKVAKKLMPLASAIPGPIGAVAKVGTAVMAAGGAARYGRSTMTAASMPALPQAPMRVMPGVGSGVASTAVRLAGRAVGTAVGAVRSGKVSKALARAMGWVVVGSVAYDMAGNIMGTVTKRRMNPLNHRALNRAIRRVCGAKKISKKIEKLTGGGGRRKVACAPRAKRC